MTAGNVKVVGRKEQLLQQWSEGNNSYYNCGRQETKVTITGVGWKQ